MVLKMDLVTVRLEVLKLVHRHDLQPEAIVERAEKLEAYVIGPSEAKADAKPAKAEQQRPVLTTKRSQGYDPRE